MRTIDKIITNVNGKYGAPMGRSNNYPFLYTIKENVHGRDILIKLDTKEEFKIFDHAVPMIDRAYDRGGAYWGMGNQLRVRYTKDLSFVEFYRLCK
ncbi:MAG: hypothetical protein ACOC33_04150 [bacterium]